MKTTNRPKNRTKTPTPPPAIKAHTTQVVHFEFNDPAARKVSIAGSFNDWHAEVGEMLNMGSGKWVKNLELAPGACEYRFVVDGKWVTDPRSRTVPNAFGETNSLLIVPEPQRQITRGNQTRVVAAGRA